jgi:ParB family transcriptional regulator, chromosome partitioning protein
MQMENEEEVMESENNLSSANKNGMFLMISIEHIIVKERIRTDIDKEGESFDGLAESIRRQGVLEPIIVISSGDSYELLCGERRLRACQRLGIENIPARILGQPLTGYDRLEIELIENILRKDLNPINEANAYRRYFEDRLKMNLDETIKNIIWYGWKDDRVRKEVVEAISTMVKFSGKSSKTIQNLLKLLELPSPIQKAIESRKINSSLGGVFASHLNHSMLMTLFHACCKNPMTKEALIRSFDQYDNPKNKQVKCYKKFSNSTESIRQGIKKNHDQIEVQEAEVLLKELNSLCELIERMKEAGEFMTQR